MIAGQLFPRGIQWYIRMRILSCCVDAGTTDGDSKNRTEFKGNAPDLGAVEFK